MWTDDETDPLFRHHPYHAGRDAVVGLAIAVQCLALLAFVAFLLGWWP